MTKPVSEGDVFAFSRDDDLGLVFVIVEVLKHCPETALARVLLLDRSGEDSFRATAGELTDWCFNMRSYEWRLSLRRLL